MLYLAALLFDTVGPARGNATPVAIISTDSRLTHHFNCAWAPLAGGRLKLLLAIHRLFIETCRHENVVG